MQLKASLRIPLVRAAYILGGDFIIICSPLGIGLKEAREPVTPTHPGVLPPHHHHSPLIPILLQHKPSSSIHPFLLPADPTDSAVKLKNTESFNILLLLRDAGGGGMGARRLREVGGAPPHQGPQVEDKVGLAAGLTEVLLIYFFSFKVWMI